MPPRVSITAHSSGALDSWRALLELAPHLVDDWILIGGQMVAVYAAGQPDAMMRETIDADIVIDLRVSNKGLDHVDRLLSHAGFVQEVAVFSGIGHRYSRGRAKFDVLSPDNMGKRNPLKLGHGRSVAVRGATRALARARTVIVELGDKTAPIRIPSPVGALVLKGSALYYSLLDSMRDNSHHREDIKTLLNCCEFSRKELPLSKSERNILKLIAEDGLIFAIERNKIKVLTQPGQSKQK